MNSLESRVVTQIRLRRIGYALLVSLILGAVFLYATDRRGESSITRGDFPAFWSLAVIANSSEPSKLYDLSTQIRIQNEAWPSLEGTVLPAAYPPYLAFMLRPMALCGAETARLLWAVCSVVLYLAGVRNIARLYPRLVPNVSDSITVMSLFAPLVLGVLGGQFLAVMIFLFSIVLSDDMKRGPQSDARLGCAVGLLFLKPYYGCAFMMSLLVSRRWRAVGVALIVVSILCWMGYCVLGGRWWSDWYNFATWFSRINFEGNWHHMPNIHAGLLWLSRTLALPSLTLIGWAVIAGLIVILSHPFFLPLIQRAWREGYSQNLYILTVVIIVMGMSQANFYDLGLVAAGGMVLFRPDRTLDWSMLVGVWLTALMGAVYRAEIGPPYFFVAGFILSVYIGVRLGPSAVSGPVALSATGESLGRSDSAI